ncbi:MAG: hypothetical protein JXQ29_14755, partial [Planctomycetes bacterium]|nr:hypothetical protein [Planctomycetota bacterium]
VVDFLWLDGSDAAFKRVCRRAAEDGLVLCEVPWDYLRFRLRKAERPTADAHPAPPPNYEGLRRWLDLEAAAATELPHPAAPVSSILEIGSPVLPPHVHHLFALPETRGWLLSTEAFAADREALEAAERSRLVLDGRDPRERVLDVLRRVIDRYRVPAVCEVWSLRLLDLALVLNGSDRARAGRIAAQVAGALAAAESTAVAHEFFRVMGMRTLDRLLAPPAAAPQAAGPAPEHDGSGLVF